MIELISKPVLQCTTLEQFNGASNPFTDPAFLLCYRGFYATHNSSNQGPLLLIGVSRNGFLLCVRGFAMADFHLGTIRDASEGGLSSARGKRYVQNGVEVRLQYILQIIV
jgi:hypothetical protein